MTMIQTLGEVCRDLREYAGLAHSRVGYHLGVEDKGKGETSLRRFEKGEVQPQRLDAVIQAYADEIGISPAAIWREAVKQYEAQSPQERAQRAIDARLIRRARHQNNPPESPAS